MLFDKINCKMLDNVRPINWVDPQGIDKYDLLVIGAGAAGLVSAAGSAGLGAKACMIERGLMGGDCLVTGCVPSKSFLKACSIAHHINNSENYGITIKGEVEIDFQALMDRMKQIRTEISHNDRVSRFTDYYGIDVFLGHGSFIDKHTVEVNGKKLKFVKAVIATGARPYGPDLYKNIKYHTSDNIFNLTEKPNKLLVVGGGPIGCELG